MNLFRRVIYRFSGPQARHPLLRPAGGEFPKGYRGRYPLPPHVDWRAKNAAYAELAAGDARADYSAYKNLKLAVLSRGVRLLMDAWNRSLSLTHFEAHPAAAALIADPRGQFIVALWHNRLIYAIYSLEIAVAANAHDILALISKSDDAEFFARMCEQWGAYTARGSSSRGGAQAFRHIVKYVDLHFHPLVTPDGPRGPVYKVKDGLVELAKMTGLPILPICYDAEDRWRFKSWDRFMLAKPFSRVALDYGEPIRVAPGEDPAAAKARVEQAMIDQARRVSEIYGHSGDW